MRWAGHVVLKGQGRNTYRILMVKLEGKRQLGKFRRRWEDKFKTGLDGME
jgi:hypothetical protein